MDDLPVRNSGGSGGGHSLDVSASSGANNLPLYLAFACGGSGRGQRPYIALPTTEILCYSLLTSFEKRGFISGFAVWTLVEPCGRGFEIGVQFLRQCQQQL